MAYFTVSKVLQSITDKGSQYEYGLHTKLKDCSSIIVHTGCRKSYTRPGLKKKEKKVTIKVELLETPRLR